ncbi:hypothetical protein [Carboxylicivirga marina]|uniref:hypothetical protein n=1 Tax=Carboxylicivirga marina TaxID=2800988 RepID=UPI0025913666|nr:hypothetical protein [uncultured Carboxylicivirga sp.]
MIELELKGTAYYLPERWEELTPEQFLFLLDLLDDYAQGKREARAVGINFAMHVLGIKKPVALTRKQRQQYYENLGWLGEMASFWWKVVYVNPELLESIDPELREKLRIILPEDMPDTPEVRVLRRAKKYLEPDFSYTCNLLPSIKAGNIKYTGYRFGMDAGLLSSDLVAGQFADAMTVAGQYGATRQPELLNHLCSILYRKFGQLSYEPVQAHANAHVFSKVSERIKQAVYLNFIGIREYLTMRTHYAVLFKRETGEQKTPTITVGFNDNLYSLAKSGYGDAEKLKQFNLFTFYDLMLKELIDAIKQMKQMDMEVDRILSSTGLSFAQYKQLAP